MPYLSPTRPVAAEATGEILLITAILNQALADRHSASADIRREAEQFWANPDAVRPWADALDLDVAALTAAVMRRRPPA
jgi:hypothetical protein